MAEERQDNPGLAEDSARLSLALPRLRQQPRDLPAGILVNPTLAAPVSQKINGKHLN